jgi:hypothetical protein
MKKLTTLLIMFCFFSVICSNSYSQGDIKISKDCKSLYNVIKSGNTGYINKISWLEKYSLVEKSLVTVTPVIFPDSTYKITFEITDLVKGKYNNSFDEGSVLGFMVENCESFKNKYADFINTSCWLTAGNPDEAIEIVKKGINFEVDQKYAIEGDLVNEFNKICNPDNNKPRPVKKPAVYLYPEKDMNIKVKLEINGQTTLTEPLYNDGWNVNATPDGLIDNKYDYLFYEANLNKIELPEEGWIVEYKNLEKWFDEYLPKLGLNEKEKSQFKDYWQKNLKKANYYEIKLLDKKFLEENMKLVISPEPQTILRLNFYFKPLFEYKEIKNPAISKFERTGFTVVEWGGINEGDLKIFP